MTGKYFYKIVIFVFLFILFCGLYDLYKIRINYYLQYYFTKTVDRYELIDYSITHRNKETKNNLSLIIWNLDVLNKRLLDLLGSVDKYHPTPATPFDLNYPPLTSDLNEMTNSLKQRMYNLAIFINRLERKNQNKDIPYETINFSKTVKTKNVSFKIILPKYREVINKRFIIKNDGEKKIKNPRVIVNNKKKWFNIDAIVNSIIEKNMTDEEKALSIWNFLNEKGSFFFPPTRGPELHNIVKYLNVYGYGICDDKAKNFYLLAEKAKLRNRVYGLTGHVVNEVYFKGDWHLLDSTCKVFFLEKDNKTIASVEDLANDSELIYRVTKTNEYFDAKSSIKDGKLLAESYATKADNYIYDSFTSNDQRMDFSLKPGESFIASWEGCGQYISYGKIYALEPPQYGCGKFIYHPILNENIFVNNLLENNKIKIINEGNYLRLTAEEPNQTASFVIDFSYPYPISGANIEILCFMKNSNDLLTISFSKNKRQWKEILRLTGKTLLNDNNLKVDFTNYFPNGYAKPLYTYFLKFKFRTAKLFSLTIKNIKIITITQLAPQSLPELENNNNIVNYISEYPNKQSTKIEFQYSLGKYYHSIINTPKLAIPVDNKNNILFCWNVSNHNIIKNDIDYNFQLSSREDFLIPLSPNFNNITENNCISIGKEWLNNNQTYYWRVRCRYKNEPWGNFSKSQKLEINK